MTVKARISSRCSGVSGRAAPITRCIEAGLVQSLPCCAAFPLVQPSRLRRGAWGFLRHSPFPLEISLRGLDREAGALDISILLLVGIIGDGDDIAGSDGHQGAGL